MGNMPMLRVAGYGLVGLMLGVSAARAETTPCTAITSLPAVITVQGVYCFTADLTTAQLSGSAIDIQTNNVTIDLNGHRLGGGAAGLGTRAIGIQALDRRFITVKNGTVRGFYVGVLLSDSTGPAYINSSGYLIEGLRAEFNRAFGISVSGTGNIVRNNQVVNTGGSTVSTPSVEGINAQGPAARVLNNDVIATAPATLGTTAAIGVFVGWAPGSVVEGNRIANTTCPSCSAVGVHVTTSDATAVSANRVSNASAVARSTGVYLTGSADALVSDNRIARLATGINFASGSGSYMNNQVTGATTPYSGGTAAGATNY